MRIVQTVLDTPDARGLAEFYRRLLDLQYRAGDEPPGAGEPDPRGEDWLVLRPAGPGQPQLAFQNVGELPRSTWPDPKLPQQLHLDIAVESRRELDEAHERALGLGAQVLLDRTADPEEPLYVFADPAGHPFCIFVEAEG